MVSPVYISFVLFAIEIWVINQLRKNAKYNFQRPQIAIKTGSLVNAFKLSCINYSAIFAYPTSTIYLSIYPCMCAVYFGNICLADTRNTVVNSFSSSPHNSHSSSKHFQHIQSAGPLVASAAAAPCCMLLVCNFAIVAPVRWTHCQAGSSADNAYQIKQNKIALGRTKLQAVHKTTTQSPNRPTAHRSATCGGVARQRHQNYSLHNAVQTIYANQHQSICMPCPARPGHSVWSSFVLDKR